MRNFFRGPETCVLDELRVFAQSVPTFLNAFQALFTSTRTSPSGFTFFCGVLASPRPVPRGLAPHPHPRKAAIASGGNSLCAGCSFPLSSELREAGTLLLSIFQYLAEGLAHNRDQKLCAD